MKKKRILSKLLLVVYSMVAVLQVVQPVEAAKNYNSAGVVWDFENGFPGTKTDLLDDGFKTNGTVEVVSNGANNSASAARLSGVGSQMQFHIGNLEPNTRYQITAWVKGEVIDGSSVLGVADVDDKAGGFQWKNHIFITQDSEWKKVTMDYITGAGITYALVYAQNDTGTNCTFLIDDISFEKYPLLYTKGETLGFEDGRIPGTVTSLLDDGFRTEGTISIVPNGANNSQYAAKVAGNGSKMFIHVGDLKPNTTYQISAWVKGEGTTGTSVLAVADSNANDSLFQFKGFKYITESSEWKKITLNYTTGDNITYAVVYAQNETESTFLIDDICLKESLVPYKVGDVWGFEEGIMPGTTADLLDDGFKTEGTVTIETNGANGSQYAAKVAGNGSKIQIHIGGLKPNTNYQISAWVKGEGATGTSVFAVADSNANDTFFNFKNIVFITEGNQWTKVMMNYRTGDNITYALLYAQNETESTFLIDDICLMESLAPYKEGDVWGFEEGVMPGTTTDLLDDGFKTAGTVTIDPNGANGSQYAAKISGAGSQMQIHIGNLEPNTRYQITALVKGEIIDGSSVLGIADVDAEANNFQWKNHILITQGTAWKRVTMDYTTGDTTYALLYAQNDTGEECTFLIDDISLTKVPTAQLAGYTITLGGKIGLNFHMKLDSLVTDETDYSMKFTHNGVTEEVALSEAEVEGNIYKFTHEVAAKEMTDVITAQMFYKGEAVSEIYTYSVDEYAKTIIENGNSVYSSYAVELVQAMLNYGSYAQKYFNYKVDDLANDGTHLGTTVLNDVTAETMEAYTNNTETGNDDVKLNSASLILESQTKLRLYIEDNGIENITYNNEPLSKKNNKFYVEKSDILPQDLDKDVTLTLMYNDSSVVEVSYNCMAYGYVVLKNDGVEDSLKDVVRALYLYGQAAKTYASQ